jgi:hypothetical protein
VVDFSAPAGRIFAVYAGERCLFIERRIGGQSVSANQARVILASKAL